MKTLIIWWVWTAGPFLTHPIRTIREWVARNEPYTDDELAHLTPEEQKALK